MKIICLPTPDDCRFCVIVETVEGTRASNYTTRENAEKIALMWATQPGAEVEIFERQKPIPL